MPKGYIYGEDGKLEEVIEHSCDGMKTMHCENCGIETEFYFDGISSVRGEIWRCIVCNNRGI